MQGVDENLFKIKLASNFLRKTTDLSTIIRNQKEGLFSVDSNNNYHITNKKQMQNVSTK